MDFYNKVKWILGILMIFALIIATNLIDKNNFIRVRDSAVSIYEDRLIAKNIIFEMSKAIQKKELAVYLSDSTFYKKNNLTINTNLKSLVSKFEKTKLTTEESIIFSDLKSNVDVLCAAEQELLKSGTQKLKVIDYIDLVKENLNDLSTIQLNEGSKQMSISKKALDTVELFTQIEIYILVFLAVLVQIIIMYKPKDTELE